MNLIPWRNKRTEPVQSLSPIDQSLVRFRDQVDDLFDRFWRDPWGWTAQEFWDAAGSLGPRVRVDEKEDSVVVEAELPGVDPKDVDVRVSDGVLTVKASSRQERSESRGSRYREERFGEFRRSIRLPGSVDPDRVEAEFKNGLLTIKAAKHPDAQPKRIAIKTDS